MQLPRSGQCFGSVGAVFGVLVALLLVGLPGAQIGSGDAFLSVSHVITERVGNQTEFVNNVLSDELPLRIVEFSQHVYDWDAYTLKFSGKWVLSSPNDNYLYYVEFARKVDKTSGFKEILEQLDSQHLITDIKRVERVRPASFQIEKRIFFGKK